MQKKGLNALGFVGTMAAGEKNMPDGFEGPPADAMPTAPTPPAEPSAEPSIETEQSQKNSPFLELPDDLKAKAVKERENNQPYHAVRLREPDSEESLLLDFKDEDLKNSVLFQEAMKRGLASIGEKGEVRFDVYTLFGGEANFRKLKRKGAFDTNGQLKPEMTEEKILELLTQEESSQTTSESTTQTRQRLEGTVQLLEELGVAGEQVENLKQEIGELKQRETETGSGTPETQENEATQITNELLQLRAEEEALKVDLSTATEEQKAPLLQRRGEIRKQRNTLLARALGYSSQDAEALAQNIEQSSGAGLFTLLWEFIRNENRNNLFESPEGQKLKKVVTSELVASVGVLMGEEDKPQAELRDMPAFQAFDAVLQKQGVPDGERQTMLQNLEAACKATHILVTENDSLASVLEQIIGFREGQSVFEGLRKYLQTQFEEKKEEEEKKIGRELTSEEKKDLLEYVFKEKIPVAGAVFGGWLARVWEDNIDVGAFMSYLLVGEGFASMAHSLGYKSAEELIKDGKTPVGVEQIEEKLIGFKEKFPSLNEAKLHMILEGLKKANISITPFEHGNAEELLFSKELQMAMTQAYTEQSHKEFSEGILEFLEFTAGEHGENNHKLTDEAIIWIMSIPHEKTKHEKGQGGEHNSTSTNSNETKPESDHVENT